MLIAIVGNVLDGFEFIGPFADEEELEFTMDTYYQGESYDMAMVKKP